MLLKSIKSNPKECDCKVVRTEPGDAEIQS